MFWVVESALGAVFGKLIPDTHALGLDFLLPIYFLGLVMSFRKRPLWLPVVIASAVASIIAYKMVGSPWHVSIGAIAGTRAKTKGHVAIYFFPMGSAEKSVIEMTDGSETFTVLVYGLTGRVELRDGTLKSVDDHMLRNAMGNHDEKRDAEGEK